MVVTGTFATPEQVSQAIDTLLARGFRSDQISAVTASGKDIEELTPTTTDRVNDVLRAAGLGALIGAVAGVALTSFVLPGVGVLLTAGALVPGGALTGGLIGALVKAGHSTEQAQALEEQVRSGRFLVTVHTTDTDETLRAQAALEDAGAEQVYTN
ncbi:MAG TPA: general stress protein [Chloroflexota bacterium]|jgi:hypothetical protein|nr:general stress protein [Chloroflexota bacterium]